MAAAVIKDFLSVDIELMNVDTARTRAERLVQEGAHCLAGPFDSAAAGELLNDTRVRQFYLGV